MMNTVKSFIVAAVCGVLIPAAAAAQSYQLVTAASELESGRQYLIVAQNSSNYYAWNGFDTDRSCGNITIGKSIVSDLFGEGIPVQLIQSEDKWKIFDTATKKYIGTTSANDEFLVGESAPESYTRFQWIISFNDGTTSVYNFSNTKYHYLKFNYNDGNSFFRAYGSSDPTNISLYKKSEGTNPSLLLLNNFNNSEAISDADKGTYDVTLQNRTLYKDGKWNTLCLPFNLTISSSVLDGADVRELNEASFSNGTLTLNFTDEGAVTELTAGTPYIIKWASGTNLVNPTFTGVTIDATSRSKECDLGNGYSVTFTGTYAPVNISASGGDNTKLFIGSNNTLYYPNAAMTIGCQRAYFQLNNGLTAGTPTAGVKAFNLNFGDDIVTGVGLTPDPSPVREGSVGGWYDLSGRQLNNKPCKSGVYIRNGKKVVIK